MKIQEDQTALNTNLIFVHGKGGVGKTTVSYAIALKLAAQKRKTLWFTFQDIPQNLPSLHESLSHLQSDFPSAFEEYLQLKFPMPALAQLFLKNSLLRYFIKAAPGLRELVLLGKIWFERNHYEHIVVDLPSTGYGFALFQSIENFIHLFQTGPLFQDARQIKTDLQNPNKVEHIILALPEETPLREALEIQNFLQLLYPKVFPRFFVNRVFPLCPLCNFQTSPDPTLDYLQTRNAFEKNNLTLWDSIAYRELPYLVPPLQPSFQTIAHQLQEYLPHA